MKARQILRRDKRPRPVRCFACFGAYADNMPLETKPVAHDKNTIIMLKPGDQT